MSFPDSPAIHPLPKVIEPNQQAANVNQKIDQINELAASRINRLQDEINQVQKEIDIVEKKNILLQNQVKHNMGLLADLERYQNPFAASEPGATRALNTHPELYETVMRRRVRAELAGLRDLMKQIPLHDEMTITIGLWAENFWEALLLNADDQEIFREFSQLLQELLTDPIFVVPLDDEALLGSDGYTYGKKSHAVWQDQVAEIYRQRSPMDPENPNIIVLSPHPIARHMVNWLKGYNLLLTSERIENLYKEIAPRQKLARIQRLKDKKAERDKEKAKILDQQEREFNAYMNKELPVILAPLIQVKDLIKVNAKDIQSKLDKIALEDKRIIQLEKQQIQNIMSEINTIDERNAQLEKKVNTVNEVISETEKENDKLQVAINNTRKAIKKQRKGQISGVFKTAAVVAACATATWGIGVLVTGGVAIMPSSGGAELLLSFTF